VTWHCSDGQFGWSIFTLAAVDSDAPLQFPSGFTASDKSPVNVLQPESLVVKYRCTMINNNMNVSVLFYNWFNAVVVLLPVITNTESDALTKSPGNNTFGTMNLTLP
jgi:hypothetical protein